MASDQFTVIDWAAEIDARNTERERQANDPEARRYFRTALPTLNKIFNGGIQAGFGGILAVTNRGKSIFTANVAKWAADDGWGVIVIPTEMHATRYASRLDALVSCLPYNKIVSWSLNSIELAALKAAVAKIKVKYDRLIKIASAPLGAATMANIQEQFDLLIPQLAPVAAGDTQKFVIIIDTAQQIVPSDRRQDKRFQQLEIGEWCKDRCETYGIPLLTTLQLGKQAAERQSTNEDVSEAYDWSRLLDWAVAIDKIRKKNIATPKHEIPEDETDEDPAEVDQRLGLRLTKGRDSEKDVLIPLEADLARMYFGEAADTQREFNTKTPVRHQERAA